jgi:TM2 domain-containing membrane protein YozV
MEGQGRGKQKVVAGVLGILLGSLGIHHFYLGSNNAGFVYLGVWAVCFVLSFVTCGIGSVLFFIPFAGGVVEGIMLLVMSDTDFDARYNQRAPGAMEFVFSKPQ